MLASAFWFLGIKVDATTVGWIKYFYQDSRVLCIWSKIKKYQWLRSGRQASLHPKASCAIQSGTKRQEQNVSWRNSCCRLLGIAAGGYFSSAANKISEDDTSCAGSQWSWNIPSQKLPCRKCLQISYFIYVREKFDACLLWSDNHPTVFWDTASSEFWSGRTPFLSCEWGKDTFEQQWKNKDKIILFPFRKT